MGSLTLTPLPPEVWADPEVVDAIKAGDLRRFLRAYRGVGERRCSQDDLARWIGCPQSTISRAENGKIPATPPAREHLLDAVLTGLDVPKDLRRRWGR